MADVFIAHIEKDGDIALEIALGLEKAGYTTWCYEADNIPGPSYLIQTGRAVEQAKAIVVIISPNSIISRQVTKEIVHAHEAGKEFIPVRRGISHIEFQNRQPEWREAMGAASSIEITPAGIEDVIVRIVGGLKAMGIYPSENIDPNRVERLRILRDSLSQQPGIEEKETADIPPEPPEEKETAEMPPEPPEEKETAEIPPEPPEEEVTAPEAPQVEATVKTGKGHKRLIITAIIAAAVVIIALGVIFLGGLFVSYSLDVVVNPANGGSVIPAEGVYDADTVVTLTATPAHGFAFDRWSGDITGELTSATVVMDEDKVVTAHFKVQYTLNTSISPAGGGTVTPAEGTYDANNVVTLTATPAQGYAFDKWSGDAAGGSTTVTVPMDSDKIVTANFKERYTLSTSISPAGSGTVTPAEGTYDADTEVTLTAVPAQGYTFDRWGGDVTGGSTTVTFFMNEQKNITAYFKLQYKLITSVAPTGGGSVTPSSGTYDAGTRVTLTANPAPGYDFDKWSDDASGTSTQVTVTMDRDRMVIANFTLSPFFEDDFSDPKSGWPIDSTEGGDWAYENGEYSLFVKKDNWVIWGRNDLLDHQSDFTVELDVRKVSEEGGGYGGIIFREREEDNKRYYYRFEIDSSTRTYRLRKKLGDEWITVRDWTSSNYILEGTKTNRLKLTCQGPRIEIYINDQKIDTINDSSLTVGYVSPMVCSQKAGAHYHFDNFKIWLLND